VKDELLNFERNKTMNTTNVRILGTNDAQDSCDCCGKTNLRRVVWLSIDENDPVAYGVSCAAKAIHGIKDQKSQKAVLEIASIMTMAIDYLEYGHTPERVGQFIVWERFGRAFKVENNTLFFNNNNMWIEVQAKT